MRTREDLRQICMLLKQRIVSNLTKPGNWNAYIDGIKADKISGANIAFMGIEVPAGKHSIELRYDNRVEIIGMIASLTGLIIGISVALILRRKSK